MAIDLELSEREYLYSVVYQCLWVGVAYKKAICLQSIDTKYVIKGF